MTTTFEATTFDLARLRQYRRERGWSQEHLADVSGVSVRTIQRLERGGAASLETQTAIAAAFRSSAAACRTSASPARHSPLVRRITPLTVLSDIGPAVQAYLDIGFAKVETDDPECIGLQAGRTALVLVTARFMAGDFGEAAIAPLVGQTLPYIWVRSVDLAAARLPAAATVIEQVSTRGGTREALVEQSRRYLIFAETHDAGARSSLSP